MPKNFDFAGYVTRNDITCLDGLVIKQDAFAGNNGMKVPLVWQHTHDDIRNVLGYMILHNAPDGVYGYGYFNGTERADDAMSILQHGDIDSMSIGARGIKKVGNNVIHGDIYEVSLVLRGANPGAQIDYIVAHSAYGESVDESQGVIYTGLSQDLLEHTVKETDMNESVGEILDTLTPDQTDVVSRYLVEGPDSLSDEDNEILETLNDDQIVAINTVIQNIDDEDDDDDDDDDDFDDDLNDLDDDFDDDFDDDDFNDDDLDDVEHSALGGNMKRNAFQQSATPAGPTDYYDRESVNELLHDAIDTRASSLAAYLNAGGMEQIEIKHGITNIDVLFPQTELNNGVQVFNPEGRNVDLIMNQFGRSPMSRVKNIYADISEDDARARGYIKGHEKLESIQSVYFRETTPQTVIRKSRIDRDDIIDIKENGIDVVSFLKETQRIKFKEEVVRAAFIGDGRPAFVNGKKNPEHIDPEHIRPITTDHELFVTKVTATSWATVIDDVLFARAGFQGTGTPTLFMNPYDVAKIKIAKDKDGKYLYGGGNNGIPSNNEIAAYFGCGTLTEYFVLPQGSFVIGNLNDYQFGNAKGGEVVTFDQFDIDFNQEKYLTESRLSGAIQTPKSFIFVTVTNPAVVDTYHEFSKDGLKTHSLWTHDASQTPDSKGLGDKYASSYGEDPAEDEDPENP